MDFHCTWSLFRLPSRFINHRTIQAAFITSFIIYHFIIGGFSCVVMNNQTMMEFFVSHQVQNSVLFFRNYKFITVAFGYKIPGFYYSCN
nr:hypothetical protein CFP56_43064 [Quercus suber]